MALSHIWVAFFLITFVVACIKLLGGDTEIFEKIVKAMFDSAATGATISLGLIGMMTFALGIMKIGEKGGMIAILARLVGPFFNKLFPEIPKNHPALGSILMNFSANALGLDNAATPLGLKAMKELQELNPVKDTASNAQIMFIVLNASSLTLLREAKSPQQCVLTWRLAGRYSQHQAFLATLRQDAVIQNYQY